MSRSVHKVLVVHNTYRHRGGEDSVVESEVALLRSRGHEVRDYRRHNDDADTDRPLALAAQALWSRRTVDEVGAVLALERPDIVHVHNTLPLVSPSVYWACAHAGIPVVQTLHNFRLACPQAMFLREGQVCEQCLGRAPWPAVVHGCYRESRAQTAVVAATVGLHRMLGTWRNKVARYIALNEFCRDKFIEAGLPSDRVVVKPNFVDAPPSAPARPREGFLYVGRLSVEKGITVLLDAARQVGNPGVRVVGSGPEADRVQGTPGVVGVGALPAAAVLQEMCAARALVIPSIWYENHPRALVEAYACGTPVIASRLGALATLVDEGRTGLLFDAGDAADLARVLRWANEHPGKMGEMGRQARAVYDAEYTPERGYDRLVAVYDDARAAWAG
jgi:glycosyltransferase involved in cell wall biosynthesis